MDKITGKLRFFIQSVYLCFVFSVISLLPFSPPSPSHLGQWPGMGWLMTLLYLLWHCYLNCLSHQEITAMTPTAPKERTWTSWCPTTTYGYQFSVTYFAPTARQTSRLSSQGLTEPALDTDCPGLNPCPPPCNLQQTSVPRFPPWWL